MVNLKKEIEDESRRVRNYFKDISEKRDRMYERGGFERALKRGEVDELLKLEGMCARRALGVVELTEEEDPKKAGEYRTAAAYCFESMGRIALKTGNKLAAAAYLKNASDVIYQGLQSEQQNAEFEDARNRMVGRENEKEQRGYRGKREHEVFRDYAGTGYKHSLSAIIAVIGILMIVMTGMPHLTGGIVGGSASGYVQMIGGFLILLAIGLFFVKRK